MEEILWSDPVFKDMIKQHGPQYADIVKACFNISVDNATNRIK